jgi:hypothetical protein
MSVRAMIGKLALPLVAGAGLGHLLAPKPVIVEHAQPKTALEQEEEAQAKRGVLDIAKVLSETPQSRFLDFAQAAATLPEPRRRHALELITKRWLRMDPPAAQDFFYGVGEHRGFMRFFYYTWLEVDPESFADWVKLPFVGVSTNSLLARLARVDHEAAIALGNDPESGADLKDVERKLKGILSEETRERAFEEAMADPIKAMRDKSIDAVGLFGLWIKEAPRAAIDYALGGIVDRGSAESFADLIGREHEHLLSNDEVWKWVQIRGLDNDVVSDDPFARGKVDRPIPISRLEDVLRSDPDAEDYSEKVAHLAQAYGAQYPEKGLEWLKSLPEEVRATSTQHFFRRWYAEDATASLQAADRLPASALHFMLVDVAGPNGLLAVSDEIGNHPYSTLVKKAADYLHQLSPDELKSAYSSSRYGSEIVVEVAPDLEGEVLSAYSGEIVPDSYELYVPYIERATGVVARLVKDDPQHASEWLLGIEDEKVRMEIAHRFYLGLGEVEDPFAENVSRPDSELTVKFARALDSVAREAFVRKAFETVAAPDDPFADGVPLIEVLKLIQDTGFSADRRGQLLEEFDRRQVSLIEDSE